METGADKHAEEQSHTEMAIKTEMEETQSLAYVEIEINVNHLKQEPGLAQSVRSEPVLLVKEHTLEDSRQGTDEQQSVLSTSTCAIVGRTNVAADSVERDQLLHTKEELEDSDLDIGPTVLQHMDSHYGTDQADLNAIDEENTILNFNREEILPRIGSQVVRCQVRDEAIESSGNDNEALAQCNSITSTKGKAKLQIYTCDTCEKSFKTKGTKKSHVNRVHGTFHLICLECNKHFKCRQYLNNHIVNVHGHQHQQECEICGKIFKRMKFLKNHIKFVHGIKTADSSSILYTCDYCLKKFHWKHSLVSHLKNMHTSKSYTCEVCKKNFESQLYLSRHVEQAHGSEEHKHQRNRCNDCLKVFKSRTYLWRHSKRVHGTGSHKCTQCYKEFKCKDYLSRHVQYTHSEEQYECDICKKTCNSKIALQNHVSCFHRNKFSGSHKQQEVEVKDSGICSPLQSLELKIHKNRLDSICRVQLRRLVTFQCELCDAVYTENHRLLQHLQRMHESQSQTSMFEELIIANKKQRAADLEDGNYRCDRCMKTFLSRNILYKHSKHVHGTGSYKCSECNKEYKCKSYLWSHINCVHSKQKYECDTCKKLFKSKISLRTHTLRLHNISLPVFYRCDRCLKMYQDKRVLNRYCQYLHSTGSHKCTECNKEFKCKAYLVRHGRDVHGDVLQDNLQI